MSNQITPNPSVPSQVVAEVKFPQVINNLGIIPTSYKDSMSYYETLAWLCKYLEETVIPTVNQNGNAVQELQNLYIELNSYVTHYFDTLDVQEEINNKLDQMASSGVLQELINNRFNYLDNEIKAVASGSPAGVYASLSALQTADPDHTKIYLTVDNGHWNYYNTDSNLWTSGGVYQASEDSETVEILDEKINKFFEFGGVNYLNLINLSINKVINSSGELVDAGAGNNTETTDYIPVTTGTYHTATPTASFNFSVVAYYDSEKTFISRVTGSNTFTVADGTSFIRVCSGSSGFPDLAMVYKGSTKPVYEPYYKLSNSVVTESELRNECVTPIKTKDVMTTTKIVAQPNYKANGYYNDVGTYASTSGFLIKKYKIDYKYQKFYFTGVSLGSAKIAMATFFDENDTIIGNNGIISSSTKVTYNSYLVIPPENADYIIFSAYCVNNEAFYIEKEIKGSKVINQGSSKMFVGHKPLQSFNTDYCNIICYGQSLSVGSDSLYVTDDEIDGNITFGSISSPSAELYTLKLKSGNQHPIVSAINSLSTLVRNNGNQSCKFVAGSYGAGGQSIAQLMSAERQAEIKQEEGYDYNIDSSGKYEVFTNALTYGKQVADLNGQSISCPAIVFLQGERDYYTDEELSTLAGSSVHAYACGGDKDLYKLYMKRLKDDMQSACMTTYGQSVKPLFCIYQVSGAFVKNKEMTINMAQVEFAQENEDVILLQSPYCVPNYSNGHLSTNGYRWYGEFIAEALYNTIEQKSEYRPMQVSDVWIEGNDIHMKVVNGVFPLTIDTYLVEQASGYGFRAFVDDVSATVWGIKTICDEIIFRTGNNLSSATKVEISYGGMEVGGTGNVRDNSPYIAMNTYWDDTNDHGQSNNLTIDHVPTDKDSNPIIDERYPMYNWLESFYKRIK